MCRWPCSYIQGHACLSKGSQLPTLFVRTSLRAAAALSSAACPVPPHCLPFFCGEIGCFRGAPCSQRLGPRRDGQGVSQRTRCGLSGHGPRLFLRVRPGGCEPLPHCLLPARLPLTEMQAQTSRKGGGVGGSICPNQM